MEDVERFIPGISTKVLNERLRKLLRRAAKNLAGITGACHLTGGLEAWQKANGPLLRRPSGG